MQKQGKIGGQDVKNAAVWRKTGQPETARGGLGKSVFNFQPEKGYMQGLGEGALLDQRADVTSFNTQAVASVQGQPSARRKHDAQKKEGHRSKGDRSSYRGTDHGNFNDPLGLGFQGRGSMKIDLSRDGDEADVVYDGHLPLIKDASTEQKGEKLFAKGRNRDKLGSNDGNTHPERDADSINVSEHVGRETEDVVHDKTASGKTMIKNDNRDSSHGTPYTVFPKMKIENTEAHKQSENTSPQKRKQFGAADVARNELPPLNSLSVPFDISDFNRRQSLLGPVMHQHKEKMIPPKAINEEDIQQNTEIEESRLCKDKTVKGGTKWLKDEVQKMRFRRSSIFRGASPYLSLSQRALHYEMYGMQRLHFTSNFTFSFFNMPTIYQEQNEFLRTSVNTIGRRKGKPKFSRPIGKLPARKIFKTDRK